VPSNDANMEGAGRVIGPPADYRVTIVLPFAYPPASGIKPRGLPRLPLEELVHRGGW
jgi:hypothetical protein